MNGYFCTAFVLVLVVVLAGHGEARSIQKREAKAAIDPHHDHDNEVRTPFTGTIIPLIATS